MTVETERPQVSNFPRRRYVCECGHVGRWTVDFSTVPIADQHAAHLADPFFAGQHAAVTGMSGTDGAWWFISNDGRDHRRASDEESRLFAVASDLLAAGRAMIAECSHKGPFTSLPLARAAIRKATEPRP